MTTQDKTEISLFLMRITIFVVMLVWTLDKFLNPGHAAAVYEKFYFMGGMGQQVMMVIGIVELLILAAFVLGIKKQISYGIVLALHTVSTFSSYNQYLSPYDGANILFFAAWPMWAACVALFLLRDQDRKWVVG